MVKAMISYKPLLKLLIDKEIRKKDVVDNAGISWSTFSKINRGEYISLAIIDKLCAFLECQPGDLIEYVPGDDKAKD